MGIFTYGGGVQSMMGVTGAQRASAEARTTMEMRPRLEERSRSTNNVKNEQDQLWSKLSQTELIKSHNRFTLLGFKQRFGSVKMSPNLLKESCIVSEFMNLLGQFGFLTSGLMMGMVLLLSLEPVSDLRVDKLTMAPTERRRLPEKREKEKHFIF